jgi:hypothetical protein
LEIFHPHAPPVDERASFVQASTPAMEAVCQELAPRVEPEGAIITGFMTYISSRWSLFSDTRYQGKKFLHMLTYFIAMNPDLLAWSPKPVELPDYYAPREGDSPGMAAWRERCGREKRRVLTLHLCQASKSNWRSKGKRSIPQNPNPQHDLPAGFGGTNHGAS